MQESIQAALSVVRSALASSASTTTSIRRRHPHPRARRRDAEGRAERRHRHRTAMVSALTGIPVRADVAMTGEITLRGEVLPIGGLKEKLLAAHRGGIKTVLIPEENVKDLAEIPDNIKNQLEIHPVKWIDQVLELALEQRSARSPRPRPVVDDSAADPPRARRARPDTCRATSGRTTEDTDEQERPDRCRSRRQGSAPKSMPRVLWSGARGQSPRRCRRAMRWRCRLRDLRRRQPRRAHGAQSAHGRADRIPAGAGPVVPGWQGAQGRGEN